MIAKPICFPRISPPGYKYLQKEPTYDQEHHLALEKPEKIYQLAELGYHETKLDNLCKKGGLTCQ
ncbi:hypothetical protein [Scytonema sp. NUACC26]|uniref:hypothetical protein n=1 Tax=Scytonema sp. NUACC26 TaxID=3140176 RepID=UPI0034DC07F9